jgi:hypothetical protein
MPAVEVAPALAEAPQPENKTLLRVEAVAQQITLDLEAQNYEVKRGSFRLYTQADCDNFSYPVMETCYGNNPAAPYVLPIVPLWPGEEANLDPSDKVAFGDDGPGYSANHLYDPREAILVFGVLPPKAAYLGVQSYLVSRQGAWDKTSDTYRWMATYAPQLLQTFFTYIPQNHSRIQVAASLSNAINNVVIQGGPQGSNPVWGQVRFFIITPDQTMDASLRQVIPADPSQVFTEPIPDGMQLGLDAASDDFNTLIRYSMPENEDEGNAWRSELPLVLLRVRYTDPTRQPVRYPAFTEPETREAADERGLQPSLKNLLYAVSVKWQQPCDNGDCTETCVEGMDCSDEAKSFMNLQTPPFNLFGPQCSAIGMNCLGDTQDTIYQIAYQLMLDGGQIYAVAGPLGTETGNATYVGLGLNSSTKKKGFDNLSQIELKNTANEFASGVPTDTAKLFVYYFARSCAGLDAYTSGHCREIPEDEIPVCTDPTGAGCDKLTISLRDYIKPGTQRGPDAALTLPPMVLKLHKPTGTTARRLYLPVIFMSR